MNDPTPTLPVKIDGTPNTFHFVGFNGARGFVYNTEKNASSHAFPFPLRAGMHFRTNGHDYVT